MFRAGATGRGEKLRLGLNSKGEEEAKAGACQGQESDQVKEWSNCWEVGNRVHTDDARSIR